MSDKDPTSVDANQRYASAAAETVSRIQARDDAVKGFVTLALALIGAALANKGFEFLAVGVGYVALGAALLSCHHDVIIGLLGLFQHRLCRSDESKTNWFSEQYFDHTLKARHYRDYAFVFILLTGGSIGLILSYPARFGSDPRLTAVVARKVIWWFSFCSLCGSGAYIWYAFEQRRRLHLLMHQHIKAERTSRSFTTKLIGVVVTLVFATGFLVGYLYASR
jgi:hypothetical protein